jgi:hypothetical protein
VESDERPSGVALALSLLSLVIALAGATIWFVAVPAFAKPSAERTCEVVFLEPGSPSCVEPKVLASRAKAAGPKPDPA